MTTPAPSPEGCPNCGARRAGRFCAECGQDNARARLELRAIVLSGIHSMLGWDTALGRTLRELARAPGRLAAEYASGRRRRYVNPARFCLFALALWLLLTRAVGLDAFDQTGMRITSSSADPEHDPTAAVRAFVETHLDVLLYLTLPLRAVWLRVFFRRSSRNVAENLVLVFYVSAFGYLLGVLSTPLHVLGWTWATPLRQFITLGWLVWAAHDFHRRGWFATAWRTCAAALLHAFSTVLVIAAITIPWILLTGG